MVRRPDIDADDDGERKWRNIILYVPILVVLIGWITFDALMGSFSWGKQQ